MKAIVCDICGKTIDSENLWERYIFWKYDAMDEKILERIDICHDCKEELVKLVASRNPTKIRKRVKKGNTPQGDE